MWLEYACSSYIQFGVKYYTGGRVVSMPASQQEGPAFDPRTRWRVFLCGVYTLNPATKHIHLFDQNYDTGHRIILQPVQYFFHTKIYIFYKY